MASLDTLFQLFPTDNEPPVSINGLGYATLDTRNSTMPQPCLDFDASNPEYARWTFGMPGNYSGGGLTATLIWSPSTGTTGGVTFGFAFHRGNALSSVSVAYTWSTTVAVTVSATSEGSFIYSSVAFTDGAQIASLSKYEMGRVLTGRLTADSGDTMTGDAEFYGLFFRET